MDKAIGQPTLSTPQVSILDTSISGLESLVSALEMRLDAVMMPGQPASPANAPAHDKLTASSRINSMSSRLAYLLDYLEV